jgi:putative colanic acid biosynthesis UDP-glucose lipid carrier transferase
MLSFIAAISFVRKINIFTLPVSSQFFALIALVTWYIATSFSKLYADRRSNKYSEEMVFIVYSLIIYAIILSSVSFFIQNYIEISSAELFVFMVILLVTLTITKYIIRKSLHSAIFQGKVLDNLLLVGATNSALDFYETINKYYYYGYKCIGFIDDHIQVMNGCPYRGSLKQLPSLLASKQIDEVVIALPNSQNKEIQKCVEVCDYYSVKARIVPNLHQFALSPLQVNNIGQLSVLSIRSLPLDKQENRFLKRVFDILFSLLFFVLIGIWLFPLIALMIKITSRGSVFFQQERWGLNNEKITCYKFRTMLQSSTDLDHDGNYLQAKKNDPRITTLGAFLRKSNLDELPQFWNVLLGNMSVVGPRPHPTPLNLEAMHTIDNYMLRHIIKPGITGWAQVNGSRGETRMPGAMQERVNFDLYYIHRWTFWFDCQIILQTVINIFRGDQNAY